MPISRRNFSMFSKPSVSRPESRQSIVQSAPLRAYPVFLIREAMGWFTIRFGCPAKKAFATQNSRRQSNAPILYQHRNSIVLVRTWPPHSRGGATRLYVDTRHKRDRGLAIQLCDNNRKFGWRCPHIDRPDQANLAILEQRGGRPLANPDLCRGRHRRAQR